VHLKALVNLRGHLAVAASLNVVALLIAAAEAVDTDVFTLDGLLFEINASRRAARVPWSIAGLSRLAEDVLS
jgi:hypothetical protein